MKSFDETIVAPVTPPGRGGVSIVRVSGLLTQTILKQVLKTTPEPRFAHYLSFYAKDGSVLDEGLAIFFPNPNSFTGEDVLELQGHGGPVVVDCLIQRIIQLGARMAKPGEFSERAFLNGKMDLAQAEAVADLINASSEQAAQSAMRSLQGEFSKKIKKLVEALIHLRTYVEAAIDFPEEEIDFLSDGKVEADLNDIIAELENIKNTAKQGALLSEGMSVVIAGEPNVGKSSLLNCLSQREAAIVTDIAGTTRDILREHINIDGMPLHIIDTAGLRESEDVIEKEGIKRAKQAINEADEILLVVDVTKKQKVGLTKFPKNKPITVVKNKIDLTQQSPGIKEKDTVTEIALSAKTGTGIDLLKTHLKKTVGFQAKEGTFIARRRHLDALHRANTFLQTGKEQLQKNKAGELLAEDLRQAQQALSEITGEFTTDDLLGRIFSSFCIGK